MCLRGTALQSFPIELFSLLQCFRRLTYAKQCEAVITYAEMLYLVPRQMDVLDVIFPEDFQRDVVRFGRHTFSLSPGADDEKEAVPHVTEVPE